MKVRLVQKDVNSTDYRPYLDAAGKQDVELIVFGELATSGALYTPRPVTPFDDLLASLKPYPFRIMTGFPYLRTGALFNAFLYYHKGLYQIYEKINLFPGMNEDKVYRAGAEIGLVKAEFGTVGVSICYDLRFPDIYARLAQAGAKWIFVPAAWPKVRVDDYRHLLVERARENKVYMIGINSVGDDGTNVFGGSTMVVDPLGKVLIQADEVSETVLDFDL